MAVEFTAENGRIAFPDGSVLAMQADAESLDLELTVAGDGDAERMRTVVQEHIDRFAFREGPLTYDWR